jgi:hypothetical protein
VEEAHALLVKETHLGHDLFSGDKVTKKTERKSFFRRLAESSASYKMYWERVENKELYLAYSENELIDNRDAMKDSEFPPPPITEARILANAQVGAWNDAGKPEMDIPTRIDYETVLFMRKPGSGGDGAGSVVSSPPYEEAILSGGGGIANEFRNTYRNGKNYGDTPGQLGSMKPGNFEDVV